MGNNQKKPSPQYNQQEQQQQKPCTGCGSLYHRSNEKERKCLEWGKKCENYVMDNRLTSVRESRICQKEPPDQEET